MTPSVRPSIIASCKCKRQTVVEFVTYIGQNIKIIDPLLVSGVRSFIMLAMVISH
jgi:hypothetical protein